SPPVDLQVGNDTDLLSSTSSSFVFCCGDSAKPCERGDINAAIRCLSERNERIAARLEMRQPAQRRFGSLVRNLQVELEQCEIVESEQPGTSSAAPASSSPVKRLASPPAPDLSHIDDLSAPVTQGQLLLQKQCLTNAIVVEEASGCSEDEVSSADPAGALCSISRVWNKLKDLTISSPQNAHLQTDNSKTSPPSKSAAESIFTSDNSNMAASSVSAARTSPEPVSKPISKPASVLNSESTSARGNVDLVGRLNSEPVEKSVDAAPAVSNAATHVSNKVSDDDDDSADEKFEAFLLQQRQNLRPLPSESEHSADLRNNGVRRHGDSSFVVPDSNADSDDVANDKTGQSSNSSVSSESTNSSRHSLAQKEKENCEDEGKKNVSENSTVTASAPSTVNHPRPGRRPIRLSTIFTSESSSSSNSSFSNDSETAPKRTVSSTQPRYPSQAPRSTAITPLTQKQRRQRREATSWTPIALSPVRHMDFLTSLNEDVPDESRHPDAVQFVRNFRQRRDQLAQYLVRLFNHTAFDGLLPPDLVVSWNRRLTTTAGYCRYQRRRVSDYCVGSDDNNDDRGAENLVVTNVGITRTCRIELSVKVCDSASRTRDTLVHELCHAACWLINGANDGHGRLWKAWTAKCSRAHPSLPPIRRCHAYVVEKKFLYKCASCGYSLARHSRSIRGPDCVCPRCRQGRLECHVNTPDGRKRLSQALRPPTAFARFVKEHYGSVRSARKSLNHAGVMRELSNKFRQVQQQQSL
ncbi:hypothetical protein BOX15_Mlig007420g2, partial [Macrostomum lignano]